MVRKVFDHKCPSLSNIKHICFPSKESSSGIFCKAQCYVFMQAAGILNDRLGLWF